MQTPFEIIREYAVESERLRRNFLKSRAADLERTAFDLARRLAAGGKILACGKGADDAAARMFVAGLVDVCVLERPALPAMALAAGCDFARQVRGLGAPGDVLVAVALADDPDVLAALEAGRERGLLTVGLCGQDSAPMARLCDRLLAARQPSPFFAREIHGVCLRLICRLTEHYLFEHAAALTAAHEDFDHAHP